VGRQTLILDSTQLVTYDECPQKWEYGDVEQLVQISGDERDSMDMGSYGHKLLENYYRGIALGLKPDNAYREALKSPMPLGLKLSKDRQNAVLDKFQFYWLKYGAGINGSQDIIPDRKRKYVIKTDTATNLPIDTYEYIPMVEMGFSHKLYESKEYLFVLEGMIDLIGTVDGMRVFMDHKWQERKRNLYKKSVQFKNYALVTKSCVGIINYVRMADKLSDDTFKRELISFSPQELRWWNQELIEKFISMAKNLQTLKMERRWGSCSGKFGYKCQFTDLCEQYNPDIREAMKHAGYKKKELWQPWKLAEVQL